MMIASDGGSDSYAEIKTIRLKSTDITAGSLEAKLLEHPATIRTERWR